MAARRTPAGLLQRVNRPVFTTREVAALRNTSVSAAAQMLARLADDGVIVRATRGVWCVPADARFSPHALVPFLAGTHPAYVSFLSAMRLHAMIEQIPHIVYAATTAHTRTVSTPVATFSFHRLAPAFFAGYHGYGESHRFLVATPEKSIVDSLYLSSRKGKRFVRLPELHLPSTFRISRARRWAKSVPDARIRSYVERKLERLWSDARANRPRSSREPASE